MWSSFDRIFNLGIFDILMIFSFFQPAQVPFSTPIRRVPFGPQAQANPLEAWLAMWAPLYQQVQQQQQARNFQYYPPR